MPGAQSKDPVVCQRPPSECAFFDDIETIALLFPHHELIDAVLRLAPPVEPTTPYQ